jgi:hypothetical protein
MKKMTMAVKTARLLLAISDRHASQVFGGANSGGVEPPANAFGTGNSGGVEPPAGAFGDGNSGGVEPPIGGF